MNRKKSQFHLLSAALVMVLATSTFSIAQEKSVDVGSETRTVTADAVAADEAKQWNAEQQAVVELSQKFDEAYSKGQIESILEMLSEDVRIVDEFGDVYEGRKAVRDLYSDAFAAQPGALLKTTIDTIRLVTPNVAVEEGVSYFTPVGGETSVVSYEAVYVKTESGWKLSQIHDFQMNAPKVSGRHSEYLVVLDWLVGDWVVETSGGVVNLKADWVDEGNAIEMVFSRNEEGANRVQARVRVGYDPKDRQIHSWTFDTAGGHGESSWAKVEGQNVWLLKNEAVLPDGKSVNTSQLLTVDEDLNSFTWATFDRSIEGVVSTTREEVVVTRKAPRPAKVTANGADLKNTSSGQ